MWNFNRKKRDTKIAIEKIHNIRKWENRPPIYVKFPLSSVIPISSNGLCFVGWCVGVLPHCCSISSQVSECPRLASFILQRWERLVVACFLCQVQLALHQHLDVSRHVRNQVRHEPGEEEHEMLSSVRHVFQSNNSNFQNSTVWILIHSYMQRFIRPCPVHSIDAAYCYRSSSKICLSMCWSQPWVLPKWLNQWICRLGGRGILMWAHATMCKMGVQIPHWVQHFSDNMCWSTGHWKVHRRAVWNEDEGLRVCPFIKVCEVAAMRQLLPLL